MLHLNKNLIFIIIIFILAGCGVPKPGGPPERPPQPVDSQAQLQLQSQDQPQTEQIQPLFVSESGSVTGTDSACPAVHFQNIQAYPGNSGYPAPQLSVTCNTNTFVVESNGIPNFEFVPTTPNPLQAQNYRWEMPLVPQVASTPGNVPLGGPVAVAVNGIPIFGPTESPQHGYGDPYLDGLLDYCSGHTAQRGDYHYHTRPDCIFTNLEGNVGLVIAYAFDGYPILAPYICEDTACASKKKVNSSWQYTQDVRNAWDAHAYVAGSGDLDQCNGLTLSNGTYAYFATDTFPYFIGCYRGVANVSRGGPPEGQAAPGDGQGPPPGGRQGPGSGGPPDLGAAAAQLGLDELQLRQALGPPPPNLANTAAQLGLAENTLRQALGIP